MNRHVSVVATALALALAFSVAPRDAFANDPHAEALYQEGRSAAQNKDWATACAKFHESHDREPAPGTLLNLADCEENLGKLLDAFAHFEAASRLFKVGDERIAYSKQRAAAIERRIPKLTVRLSPTAPTGTTVEKDGVPVGTATLGSAMTVDPGEHTLIVHASGRTDVKSTLRLAEGESREVELAPGAENPASAPLPAAPAVGSSAPGAHVATTATAPAPGRKGSAMRAAGFVALGVGAVGVAVGVVGGLITANAKSTVDANCLPSCNPEGQNAQDRGKTWSTVSTVGFVGGGVALAAGAALLLFAPSSKPVSNVGLTPLPGGALVGWGRAF